jgi:hypothetical protein
MVSLAIQPFFLACTKRMVGVSQDLLFCILMISRRSKPIIQRSQPIPPSAYQVHLDAGLRPPPLTTSSVRYWSDYSRLYYHPKSLVQLSEFELSDTLMPFETWETGLDLFEKMEREVDVMDRDLRPFVEQCDGMQGIQIMTGVDDAWGGWTSGWLERLRDEYGKLSIWTWGLGDQGGNMAVPRVRLPFPEEPERN